MPLFLINNRDKRDSVQIRLANRDAHLDWMAAVMDQILMAGPVLSEDEETMIGSTILVEFDTLQQVRDWAAQDPYAKANLFDQTEILPYRWVLGDGRRDG